MRVFNTLAALTILTCLVAPAKAEEVNAANGMHYTRVQDAPTTDNSYIKLKTVEPDDQAAKKPEPEDNSQVRIWNKYKALASGTAGDDDKTKDKKTTAKKSDDADDDKSDDQKDAEDSDKDSDNKPAKSTRTAKQGGNDDPAQTDKVDSVPARPAGIEGIIDDYRRNKAQQSQMHTLTITNPDDLPPDIKARMQEEKTQDSKEKPEG